MYKNVLQNISKFLIKALRQGYKNKKQTKKFIKDNINLERIARILRHNTHNLILRTKHPKQFVGGSKT